MRDDIAIPPPALAAIARDAAALGFIMSCEPKTGALLRCLAASKPSGRMLEIGTGAGAGTAWLLAGMDCGARLLSIDNDDRVSQVAKRHLGQDARVTFEVMDAAVFLEQAAPEQFDLVYADAWPGKFTHLDHALRLLKVGGIYVIDDLLPQVSWPEGHAPRVPALIAALAQRRGFVSVQMAWASGLMMLVRTVAG
jgi:predicted O-methyltransferase YrrM